MFPPDFKERLSVFNSRKVKYLLVGGYAVSLHAQPRATKDLDCQFTPSHPSLTLAAAVASDPRASGDIQPPLP